MRTTSFILLTIIVVILSGCRAFSNMSHVRDHSLYDSGEIKTIGSSHASASYLGLGNLKNGVSVGHTSEYYKNGKLQTEVWSLNGKPRMKLNFYENGRLQSEERFDQGERVYGS